MCKGEKTGPLTYIDQIRPSFGKIKLGYKRDRLCDLCTDRFFFWARKSNHCGYKLRLEGILVGKRDGELVLESLSETAYRIEELLSYIVQPSKFHSIFEIHAGCETYGGIVRGGQDELEEVDDKGRLTTVCVKGLLCILSSVRV